MTWMLRRALKAPLVAKSAVLDLFRPATPDAVQAPEFSFLVYHRVYGDLALELDLNPRIFLRQMEWLATQRRVIAYDEALSLLDTRQRQTLGQGPASPAPPDRAQPAVILTFDDGYLDFYTCVFPILAKFRLPAILFVTTGFIEEGTPYPMLTNPEATVRPVTWDMLGEMYESGLISLGAHTHTHPILTTLGADHVAEELSRPIECFERRLGFRPRHFAYPRALTSAAVRTLVSRYYSSAVVGGGRPVTGATFDRYCIPRIPIRRSDGWRFFKAKMRGWLGDEEAIYARLHSAAAWRKM